MKNMGLWAYLLICLLTTIAVVAALKWGCGPFAFLGYCFPAGIKVRADEKGNLSINEKED